MATRPNIAAAVSTNPFILGVTSGEPAPDGVVLWTRLAPDPLSGDGLGGMGERRTDVEWEIADDEGFRQVVRRGAETTGPDIGHSVHVELTGLTPGREFFYRFLTGAEISPIGRTRTAPPPTAMEPLTMCFTSCSHFEQGFFTAYRRLAEDEPELVLHLGDYLYENPASAASDRNVRRHAGPEIVTLTRYRQRHAQYRTDADLQAAHAVAPWLVVWDDHEIDDNWPTRSRRTRSPTSWPAAKPRSGPTGRTCRCGRRRGHPAGTCSSTGGCPGAP